MNDHPIRNMEEFSQLSGISRPTLSKYFNDPASVRASTRAQIEQALQRYDYRPNLFAVNLNKRKPKIVGIVVPDLGDPFFARLVQLIEDRCAALGLLLMVLSSGGEASQEARAIETLLSFKIAGAVLAPLGRGSKHGLIQSLQARIPIVFVDSRLDEAAAFVGTDNHQSIGLITDYLCRTGERPTFFDMPAVNHNAAERRAAYVAAMERLGLQPEIVPVPTRRVWSFEEVGYTTALAMIDGRGGFPTRTLLCANDRIAVGVMAAAFARGIRVGRDPDCGLRVAGHDDQPLSRFTCPPLTTVAQDFERLAETALDILLARIDGAGPADPAGTQAGDRAGDQVRLEARLVMRASA
jgi:DNA-binding LacI/PurR family transcriptional regulator